MSASTPGPWKLDTDGRVRDALGRYIADVGDGLEISDAEANARLIAAAPDLLAALIETHDLLECVGYDSRKHQPLVDRARAAVAGATGATS